MDKIIITIGRQYGSGGKEIGEKIAKELGIPFYDKELLTAAAKKSGICEEMFESHDEKPTSSFLYSLVVGSYASGQTPMNHKLFLAQFDAIKEIASQGSCVILGRCADYALEDDPDVINVFIHADKETRIKRAVKYYNVEEGKAEDVINKTDKQRASYYNFYSGKKWGNTGSYDLSVNSGFIGIDNTVKTIIDFVEKRKEFKKSMK
ncbi:cytidylate kinase-like family protein [Anaerotignum faecicola]|nr:cytidylate kinase-like family protein [Anaerotignum faecicola]